MRRNWRRHLAWGLAMIVASSVPACGYAPRRQEFRLGKLGAPEGRETWRVFVPVVDNSTAETGFEPVVTSALRRVLAGIRGLTLVNDAESADLLLLGHVQSLGRSRGEWTVPGNPSTELRGGLARGKFTAANVVVSMKMEASLFRKVPGQTEAKEKLWTRTFTGGGRYEASTRFYESGALDPKSGGSSSAPFVNRSREEILLQIISQDLANGVVDQVVQDF